MHLRLVIALVALVVLGATHWKAYHSGHKTGRADIQQQWDAERAAAATQTLAASESARAKEQALASTVERVRNELEKQKLAAAAAARESAHRLRDYESALADAVRDRTAEHPGATSGATGPFAAIAGECGRALIALDEHARGLEAKARALQNYTAGVCVTPPSNPQ
jgi:hypothetical protein